jgi:hypothetical protein
MKKVSIYCDGGLGNRLCSLIGGLHLSYKLNYDFEIIWLQTRWCNCNFEDLFDNNINHINLSKNLDDYINENNILGLNSGIFAFNKSMINHLKEINIFFNKNLNLVNSCLEQPFINVYLFRNKIYNTILNDFVSHAGYNTDTFFGTALHFAGGPGNFPVKYDKMKIFFNKNFPSD